MKSLENLGLKLFALSFFFAMISFTTLLAQEECFKEETADQCDEWVVLFKDQVTNAEQRANELAQKYGFDPFAIYDELKGFAATMRDDIAQKLPSSESDVDFVERNLWFTFEPVQPISVSSTTFSSKGQRKEPPLPNQNQGQELGNTMKRLFNLTTKGETQGNDLQAISDLKKKIDEEKIKVAVVELADEGVTHEDINLNKFVDCTFLPVKIDGFSKHCAVKKAPAVPTPTLVDESNTKAHGLRVQGFLGAKDNGKYIVGSAPNVPIVYLAAGIPVSELPTPLTSKKLLSSMSEIISAVDWVLQNKTENIKIINMSFVWNLKSIFSIIEKVTKGKKKIQDIQAKSTAFEKVIGKALDQGIIPVATAGNDTQDIDTSQVYPANITGVVTIASVKADIHVDGLPCPNVGTETAGNKGDIFWDDSSILGRTENAGSNFGKNVDFAISINSLDEDLFWENSTEILGSPATSWATAVASGIIADYMLKAGKIPTTKGEAEDIIKAIRDLAIPAKSARGYKVSLTSKLCQGKTVQQCLDTAPPLINGEWAKNSITLQNYLNDIRTAKSKGQDFFKDDQCKEGSS